MNRERQVYNFIENYILQNSYPPTLQEIADNLGTVKSVVFYHVEHMILRGILYQKPNTPRALRIEQCYFEAGAE